jgi:hypothetical protein
MIKIKGYKILNNIYLLYLVFFVTLINLFSLMYNKNYKSVILFSVIVLTIYLFNKNMIIILLTALIITNIMNLTYMSVSEGYNNKKKEDESIDEDSDEEDKIKEKSDEDDIVKKLGNIAIESLLNKYEDVSDNTVDNVQSLQETNKETTQLSQKIDKATNTGVIKEKNDLMYDKINELNSKMNELTALIQ